MAYHPTQLAKVQVQKQSDWGKSNAIDTKNFVAGDTVEAQAIVPELSEEALEPEVMRGDWHARQRFRGSREGTEISLTMPLHGVNSSTPSGDPSQHPDAIFFESVLGGQVIGGYQSSALNDGSSTSFKASSISNIVGQATVVPLATSGHGMGFVTSVDTVSSPNEATIRTDYPDNDGDGSKDTPAGSGDIFGSITIYKTSSDPNPFTLRYLGSDSGNNTEFRLYDCVVTGLTMTLNVREQPQIEVTIRAGGWINDGGSNSVSDYQQTLPTLPALIGRNGARVVTATAPGTAGDAHTSQSVQTWGSISIELSRDVQPVGAYHAEEGVSQYVTTNKTAQATVEAPASDLSSLRKPGDTADLLQVELNRTPGNACAICIPLAQVREIESLQDMDGLVGSSTEYDDRHYANDSGTGANGAGNKSFAIAFA